MAKRDSSSSKLTSSPAELRLDDPSVRELLDHLAEELAKEYISLMKETAEKPGKPEE
jgi:hypothetical protein